MAFSVCGGCDRKLVIPWRFEWGEAAPHMLVNGSFVEAPVMAAVQNLTLRRSITQALAGSPDVAALLGGVRIHDEAPPAANFPFITLGQSVIRDWSTGIEDGAEQSLTLHVWSPFGGKKRVQDIIEAIRAVLRDRALLLADRQPVNLRHEFSEVRLDPDGDSFHGIIRYRAISAPAQAVAA